MATTSLKPDENAAGHDPQSEKRDDQTDPARANARCYHSRHGSQTTSITITRTVLLSGSLRRQALCESPVRLGGAHRAAVWRLLDANAVATSAADEFTSPRGQIEVAVFPLGAEARLAVEGASSVGHSASYLLEKRRSSFAVLAASNGLPPILS